MAETKWDELPTDCLVKIFTKIETEEIAESVQYVCKSWYQATFNPQCWQALNFTRIYSHDFVEFAVRRSQNSATTIFFGQFHPLVTDQTLAFISQNCPKLKVLLLPYNYEREDAGFIRDAVRSWKDLEYIGLWKFGYYIHMLESIYQYCKNFKGVILPDVKTGDEEASLIVKFLPKIKVLKMPLCRSPRWSSLLILIFGKELKFVDIMCCIGFDAMGDYIGVRHPKIKP